MAVPIEQAACNALKAWLQSKLPDVVVSQDWPAAEPDLPEKAITILLAGEGKEELLQPQVVDQAIIHAAVSTTLSVVPATDLPTAIAKVNVQAGSYEAHRASTAAHQAADSTNVLTAPVATDLPTAIARANNLRTVVPAHIAFATSHENLDDQTAITAPAATDLPTLLVLVNDINRALNRHYTARLYTWRIAEIERPVQLDVWAAKYARDRNDLEARLVPLLNACVQESAGLGFDDPVENGVIVALADGWTGTTADFQFDAPARELSADQTKRGEFRTTYRGTLFVPKLVVAQSPRLAMMQLQRTEGDRTGTATVRTSPDPPGYTVEYT